VRILRRFGLGIGAALVVAGAVAFAVGHEAVRVLIALGPNDSTGEVARNAFRTSLPLMMFGAGFLAFSLGAVREKKAA
jgi:hypothetical protein